MVLSYYFIANMASHRRRPWPLEIIGVVRQPLSSLCCFLFNFTAIPLPRIPLFPVFRVISRHFAGTNPIGSC